MRAHGVTWRHPLLAAVAAGVLLAAAPAADAQQIRCWTNASGSRECSDLPPPANAKSINEVRGRAGRIEGQESFAQRQAAERFPVTLWSSDCGEPCTNARKLLASRGVPFTDRNPAQPAQQEEFKRLTKGQMQVPLLIVGTSQLTGFEEGQWNSTLDAAGYSRVATSGPRRPTGGSPASAATSSPASPRPGQTAAGAPGIPDPAPAPVQTGPGGTVVPPPNAGIPGAPGQQSPGFAPLPETSVGPGQAFSPAGPAPGGAGTR